MSDITTAAPATEPASDALQPFKPFQFIAPDLLDGKQVSGRPVAELLNHTLDVVHGVQSIMGLLETRGLEQHSEDDPPYLDGYTAGTLERLAIRALNQLGHQAQVLCERIQADADSEQETLCA